MNHIFPWVSAGSPAAIVVGLVLLLLGRRLFWLFVGVVGFMAGWYFVMGSWNHAPGGTQLLLALGAGVLGIILALVAQKIAVALAGFAVGWSAAAWLLGWQAMMLRPGQLAVLVAAGVIAAVLAVVVFDFALIFYSALAGASLIVEHVRAHHPFSGDVRMVALVVLVVIGIAVQMRLLERGRAREA